MMKRILILLCFFTLFFSITAKAQNFITHKVKANETVLSIATKYNITKIQIYGLNPDAKKGLELGSILIIPTNIKENRSVSDGDKLNIETNNTSADSIKKIVKSIKEYKLHKVKRKETLYSLSKLYNISQEDLKKHNPSLYSNNLRKGNEIKIPVFKTEVVTVIANSTKLPKGKYIVKAKEGKWRIAYSHGITIEELNTLNPKSAEVLQIGDTINVPVKTLKILDDKYSYYTVLPKEGFYRLKLKLGLSQEELELLNPELKIKGLKKGMVLKIPFNKSALNSVTESSISVADSLVVLGNLDKATDLSSLIKDRSLKKIAFMLPLKLNTIQLDSVNDTNLKIENDKLLNLSLEFYSGVEMALNSLKKMGLNLDVKIIDTQNRQSICLDYLDEIVKHKTDVVIGPFMPSNFNMVAKRLVGNDIPVINPLTKKVDLGNNVFQSRPSESLLQQKIINYIKKDSTSHIVIVHDSKHEAVKDILKKEFPNASVIASNVNKKTDKDNYFIYDIDMVKALKPGKNIVFVETAKEGLVSNVTSILNSKNNLGSMSVELTTTERNKAFQGDEVSNYHLAQLNFTFPAISKINNANENRHFIDAYKAKYNETPSSYATRGFDLTLDVVLRISTSETLYHSVREVPLTQYLENKFSYSKSLLGGFQNNAIFLLKYDGLNIIEIE